MSSSAATTPGEDFPLVCETCLGPNPYVRMTKLPPQQKLCTISHMPYQAFRWKAGPGGRYKETVVSYTIARDRNLCQCCLNDMRFGLPVGVRDALLRDKERDTQQRLALPSSLPGVQHHVRRLQDEQAAADLLAEGDEAALSVWDETDASLRQLGATRQLESLAHSLYSQNAFAPGGHGNNNSKIAFRNLPKLCSFWLNGTCNRVLRGTCPFRPCCGAFVFPEIAGVEKELHKQLVERLTAEGAEKVMKTMDASTRSAIQKALRGNKEEAIRKRVAGEDELTKSYLGKIKSLNTQIQPPDDVSIVTLWLGNLAPSVSEEEIRAAIEMYAPICSLRLARASQCAFVEFFERSAAELVANALYNALTLGGLPVRVNWAKAKRDRDGVAEVLPEGAQSWPAPPGLEHAPRSMYALPNLPLPVVIPSFISPVPPPRPPSGPPPVLSAPPPPPTSAPPRDGDESQGAKRQRVEEEDGKGASGLALLGEYADDDE